MACLQAAQQKQLIDSHNAQLPGRGFCCFLPNMRLNQIPV